MFKIGYCWLSITGMYHRCANVTFRNMVFLQHISAGASHVLSDAFRDRDFLLHRPLGPLSDSTTLHQTVLTRPDYQFTPTMNVTLLPNANLKSSH